jgi:hypothetical protein
MLPELWTIICHELDIYSLYNFCISYKFSYDICSTHEFWINHFKLHNVNMINKQYNFFKYINEFMVDNIINEILLKGKCNVDNGKELKCICKDFKCDKIIIKNIITNIYSYCTLYNNRHLTNAIYIDCDYIEILFEENPAFNIAHSINKDVKNINKLYTLLHQLCDEKIINYKNLNN